MSQDKTVGMKVLYASRLLRRSFDNRVKDLGLTRAQWQAIVVIRRQEGVTQRQLAKAMEIGEVAAGQLVDRLAKDGWITRCADPADRRAKRLYIDPAAAKMMLKLIALGEEQEEQSLARLDEPERAVLSASLDKIIGNLLATLEPEESSGSHQAE